MGALAPIRIGSIVTSVLALAPVVIFGQTTSTGPMKTTLCELVKTPDQFNGKMVEFRAEFVSKFQWEGFVDESCSAKLQIGVYHPLDDLKPEQGQYAFTTVGKDNEHPERLNWKPIPPQRPVDLVQDDNYRAFRKCADTKFKWPDGGRCLDCPLYRMTVTATGRFDHFETHTVAVRLNPATNEFHHSGNSNDPLSRLVLQSVSDVVPTPISPSVYSESGRRNVSSEEANDLVCAWTGGCGSGGTALVPSIQVVDEEYYHLTLATDVLRLFDVDAGTGDVWSGNFFCLLYESPSLAKLQRAIRQRIGLTEGEYKKARKPGPMCEPGQKPRVERRK